VLAYTDVLNAI